MKKSIALIVCIIAAFLQVNAQKATNYSCKLDNGIVIKTEKTWGNVWIQQSQAEFKAGDDEHSVDIIIRPMGDLISQGTTTSKLLSAGKEVKMTGTPAGTYDMKIEAKLSGKAGTVSFDVPGIVVKAKMKTTVTVTIYDYQILIEETAAQAKGLAAFESKILRYKGNPEVNTNMGVPSFFTKGAHDKAINPDEKTGNTAGKIKPGTYDLLVSIEISGRTQKVWLENFTMKGDVAYRITTNMNAGEITYAGVAREVKQMHLYPAGTADKMQGAAKPDKTMEIISYEPAINKFACRPGTYDVLLNYNNGAKYEWKKNQVVRTATRTDVK